MRAGKEELLALLLVGVSGAALLHSRAMMLGLPASGGLVSSVSSHSCKSQPCSRSRISALLYVLGGI